jgi:hypothetical protein
LPVLALTLATVAGAAIGLNLSGSEGSGCREEASGSGSSASPDGPSQFSATRQDVGPGLSADQATQQVLGGLGDPSVVSATVGTPSLSSGESGRWLTVTMDRSQGDAVEREWLAQLVQGAVEDLMRTHEATTSQVLQGAELVTRDESGHRSVTDLGFGAVVGGQVFGCPSDDALRHQVAATAERYGLTVDSVEVLHPLESALVVTMTVPDGPLDGWTLESLQEAIEGGAGPTFHPDVEGLYLELRSPSGAPLVKSGVALRIPGGGGWSAPGQDERFGISHG